MKKIYIHFSLSILIVVISGFIFSCSKNEFPHDSNTRTEVAIDDEKDPLLVSLLAYNDSVRVANQNIAVTQGWGWLIKIFRVVEADVKGAIYGFTVGFGVNPGLSVPGAIVGGALFSAVTGLNNAPSLSNKVFHKNRYDNICLYVVSNSDLIERMKNEYNEVELNLENEYSDLMWIGAAHNACLYLYFEDDRMYENHSHAVGNAVLTEQFLLSTEYKYFYDDFMFNCDSFCDQKICETVTYMRNIDVDSNMRIFKIIDIFNEGLRNCNSMLDVNNLANSYYKIIEGDEQLTYNDKLSLYSGMITGAFSASFWMRFANHESPFPEVQ